jgi:hypothetical protein
MASKEDIGSAFYPMFIFFIITSVYFLLKAKFNSSKSGLILSIIYILVTLIIMFFINLNLTKSICDSNQYDTAALVTFLPWILLFGLLKLMLSIFPGWLSPFSNTIGYLVARLNGVTDIFNKILSPKMANLSAPESLKIATEALEHIYNDKSLLINEITQTNFDRFWEQMSNAGMLKRGINEFKEPLRQLVRAKDLVAEYVWYLLTGLLVTSVSYNIAIDADCKRTVQDIKNIDNERLKEVNKLAKKTDQIYKSYE